MTWKNALAESAFMMGMEKAEGIGLACYAPLLNNVGYTNWKPDLINFDNRRVFGTPSYYVQKLFMNYQGKQLVRADTNLNPKEKKKPKLYGRIRFASDQAQVSISDLHIRNEDTGKEICPEDFTLGANEREKDLADVAWDNYRISFRYRRETGGTAETLQGSYVTRMEFAMKDEKNCMRLLLDGWERTAALNGMVDGFSCCMGMSQLILEQGKTYDCCIQVNGSHIRAAIGGCVLEHECVLPEPEELYYSAVTEEDGSLIVKLSNVTKEKKLVRIRPQLLYSKVREISISGCAPEWTNSLEEPEKVSPKEREIQMSERELLYEMPEYGLTFLKFVR